MNHIFGAKKGMGKKNPVCYICGTPAMQRDHLPPKGCFPPPRPSNLITVDICNQCHRGTDLDDEYFKFVVSIQNAGDPHADWVIESCIRGFIRRPNLLRQIWQGAHRRIPVQTSGGLIVGFAPGFRIEQPRIQRVIDRIVRGLYFHKYGVRLGPDYRVLDYTMNPDRPDVDKNEAWRIILSSSPHDSNDKVFSYRMIPDKEDPKVVFFGMQLYENTLFVAGTEPVAGVLNVKGVSS